MPHQKYEVGNFSFEISKFMKIDLAEWHLSPQFKIFLKRGEQKEKKNQKPIEVQNRKRSILKKIL